MRCKARTSSRNLSLISKAPKWCFGSFESFETWMNRSENLYIFITAIEFCLNGKEKDWRKVLTKKTVGNFYAVWETYSMNIGVSHVFHVNVPNMLIYFTAYKILLCSKYVVRLCQHGQNEKRHSQSFSSMDIFEKCTRAQFFQDFFSHPNRLKNHIRGCIWVKCQSFAPSDINF